MNLQREKAIIKVLIAINLIFFGVIGLPYELKRIYDYSKVKVQTSRARAQLEDKYAVIINSEADAISAKKYLDVLDKSVPNNQSSDAFITDVTTTASTTGFSVDSINITPKEKVQGFNVLHTAILLKGDPNELPVFIQALEKITRINQLDIVDYTSSARGTKIRLELFIYSYGDF